MGDLGKTLNEIWGKRKILKRNEECSIFYVEVQGSANINQYLTESEIIDDITKNNRKYFTDENTNVIIDKNKQLRTEKNGVVEDNLSNLPIY